MTVPDAFPRTRRPLPWVLASFLALLYLVPVDQTRVKLHLPFNSELDRFAVMGMVLAWIVLRGDQRTVWRSQRARTYVIAMALFFAILLGGLVANAWRAIHLNEWTLAQKQFTLLLTLFAVSWFTMTALRLEDLRGISTLLIGLGVALGVGMLVEAHTGYNVFYSVSGNLLKPIARVAPPGTLIDPGLIGQDRVSIVGPTSHGLAAVTMLAIVIPFALVRVLDARSQWSALLNVLALAIMTGAAFSTEKKTAPLALIAVFLFVGLQRPRSLLRLAPLGVLLIAFVHVAAPGALGTILDPTRWFATDSTSHRAADFSAIWPDVLSHPLLGRGFGTIDITRADQFRIMDNQLLGMLWQAGALGVLAYLWTIVSPIVVATRARRTLDPTLASVALAASAGCAAFLVVNYLFDALSFVQAPYMFFVVAAMCTVASGVGSAPERVPALLERIPATVPA